MQAIVFLDRGSLRANIRTPAFAHRWHDHDKTAPDEVLERLHDATIAITNKVPLPAETIVRLPLLKMIAVAATGTDIVDLEACRERGVVVSNIRHYATSTLPEHVFALILALRRNLVAYRDDIESGLWQRSTQFCLLTQPIDDLSGSTLGIIGFGVLGKAVAKLGMAFGMRVLAYDPAPAEFPGVELASVERIVEEGDVISLHVPLTPATHHMIGRAELDRMKPHCVLINTARGGLVDERALAEALQQRRIGGAGFDVLTREPPGADNPLVQLRLFNFILTPHVAWASTQAMQGLADQLIDNIEAFVSGSPRNVVA